MLEVRLAVEFALQPREVAEAQRSLAVLALEARLVEDAAVAFDLLKYVHGLVAHVALLLWGRLPRPAARATPITRQ